MSSARILPHRKSRSSGCTAWAWLSSRSGASSFPSRPAFGSSETPRSVGPTPPSAAARPRSQTPRPNGPPQPSSAPSTTGWSGRPNGAPGPPSKPARKPSRPTNRHRPRSTRSGPASHSSNCTPIAEGNTAGDSGTATATSSPTPPRGTAPDRRPNRGWQPSGAAHWARRSSTSISSRT